MDLWEKETEAALGAMEAGVLVTAFKVVGQRRVLALLEIDSHDALDRIAMGGLPIAHHLEFKEVAPVREYKSFAEDVRARWKSQ